MALLASLALAGIAAGKPGTAARPALVERGLYLTTIMGCNDCHTPGTLFGAPDFERRLSGSEMGWRGPWGVSFARNLTPDLETGIGYWSEKEIIDALRTGVKNDGETMLPPMPWMNYAGLSDADAQAIAAYLLSLPPVKHRVPDAVPAGQPFEGPVLEFPSPPAWDAPRRAEH